jgi:hypothetical protein
VRCRNTSSQTPLLLARISNGALDRKVSDEMFFKSMLDVLKTWCSVPHPQSFRILPAQVRGEDGIDIELETKVTYPEASTSRENSRA